MKMYNPKPFLISFLGALIFISSCKKHDLVEGSNQEPIEEIDSTPRHLIKEYVNHNLNREYYYSDLRPYAIINYEKDSLVVEYIDQKISSTKYHTSSNSNSWYTNNYYYDTFGYLNRFDFNKGNLESRITYDSLYAVSFLDITGNNGYKLEFEISEGNANNSLKFYLGHLERFNYTHDNHENPLHQFWVVEPIKSYVSTNNILTERVEFFMSDINNDFVSYDTVFYEYSYQYNDQFQPIEKIITNTGNQDSTIYTYEYIDL